MSNNKFNVKYCILLPIVLTVTIFLWCCPTSFFGSLGDVLTVTQQRTIAIFAFAALMWIFEIVPNWVTSLMVIVVSLLTISTKSISFCMNTGDASLFVPMKELMRAFSDPVVMLFLGGFVCITSGYGQKRQDRNCACNPHCGQCRRNRHTYVFNSRRALPI